MHIHTLTPMHTRTHTHQASSGSLDHYAVDDKAERRSSIDNKHYRLERKGSGHNVLEKQSHHEKTLLERRSSSGDRLSVTPDNKSPSLTNSSGIGTMDRKYQTIG